MGQLDYLTPIGAATRLSRRERRELELRRRNAAMEALDIEVSARLDKLRQDTATDLAEQREDAIERLASRATMRLGDIDHTRRLETVRAGNRLFDELAVQIEVIAARKLNRVIEDF